jgi:hypothetical protein
VIRRIAMLSWMAALLFLAGCATTPPSHPGSVPAISTTLGFGMATPTGKVTEEEWQTFLREEVTPRFPDGFTVWNASGQYRMPKTGQIVREPTRILWIVHPGGTDHERRLGEIIHRYKIRFRQESVMRTDHPVHLSFP